MRNGIQLFLPVFVLTLAVPFALAHAQGCSPASGGAGSLPPCCATTDMSGGGDCMAPAAQYQFTLYNVGFEKSDGTVVEFGAPRMFDAASVGAGADIGNFISGANLQPGAYVAVRPSLSRNLTVGVSNATTRDGRSCSGTVTAASLQPNGDAWPNCAAGQPDAAVEQCLSGGQIKVRDSQIGTLNVSGSGNTTINFKFDVNNGAVCHFAPGNSPAGSIGLGVLSVRITKS